MSPPSSRLSQSPSLRIAASVFGTIFIAFGINAILNPLSALSFFELAAPSSYAAATAAATGSDNNTKNLIDSLMIIYGARDVFMGLAIYATAYFANGNDGGGRNNNKALGWILIAGSGVAFVDGGVCKGIVGKGEWNHWGYAPILAAVGLALLGVLDG